jgi:3-oxoacyl-[acyl-carrier protein] reductase
VVDLGIQGKTVVVTGGSGDIGAAIALAFAREGAVVAVGYRSRAARAEQAARAIRASGGAAFTVRIDQSAPDDISRTLTEVQAAAGPVEILVANAVAWPAGEQDWSRLVHDLTANVAGTITLTDSALPSMRACGWGRVVYISSDVVDQPAPAAPGYPAAKAAVEAAARVYALREAEHGILTNIVRPGFTLTDRARTVPGFGQDLIDAESAKTPTRRICTPEDVAGATLYLASTANTHINGEVLSVAGGRHLTR